MSQPPIEALVEQVAQLTNLVQSLQARLEAMESQDSAGEPEPSPVSRRSLFAGAAAASLGAWATARPAQAQAPQWGPGGPAASAPAGYLLKGYTGLGNTALGRGAGELLGPDDISGAQGRWNTAVGVEALQAAVPASIGMGFGAQRDTAVGRGALRDTQDGFYNDAFGADAGRHCNRANRNTFLGNNAGKWVGSLDPQADSHPWWLGTGVQDLDLDGSRNVLVGRNAGHEGVRLRSCVAVGYNAGANWGLNEGTTVVGRNALIDNPVASRSVAVGCFAMDQSTSGGGDSVALGFEALREAQGDNNVALGAFAGRDNKGGQNVFVGEQAGLQNAAGSDNVMLGRHAGQNNDGSGNIFLGRMAGRDFAGRSSSLVIHNSASAAPFLEGSMGEGGSWWLKLRGDGLPHADAVWSLGGPSLRWKEIWSQNGSIQTSDERMKRDVRNEELGLAFVEALRPVTWHWKEQGDAVVHRGLLAGEVSAAAQAQKPERPFDGVVDGDGVLGLREREFLGPMILAIQELSRRVQALESL